MKPASRLALGTLVVASAFVAAPAHAQWMWKDEAGHVVASDQPPPPSVPPSRIMKSPKQRAADLVPASPVKEGEPRDAAKAGVPKTDGPKSLAERDLEFKQHQKEAAEAAKKAEAEAARAKAMQENCTAVRGNLASLQGGGRLARVNEKGERTYLDDAQRKGEIAAAQTQIAQYCK